MDQVAFAVMTSLVLLGKFADFLMQSAADRSHGAAAAAGEVEQSGPVRPVRFTRGAIDGAHDYLVSIFLTGFFNPVRLWRVFLISAFLVQGSFLFSSLIKPEIWSLGHGGFPWLNLSATLILLIAANFVFDLIAISLILYILKHERGLEGDYALRDILRLSAHAVVLVGAFYVIMVSTMNLSFSLILHLQGVAAGYDDLFQLSQSVEMHQRVWRGETLWRFLDPIAEGGYIGLNGVNLFIFCLTPMLAPILVVLVLCVGAFLDIADAATGDWISRYVRDLAWRRRPFFLKFASIIALLGSGASALL